jgi:hypothetical protein
MLEVTLILVFWKTGPMPVEAFINEENPYDIRPDGGSSTTARFWYPTGELIPILNCHWTRKRFRAQDLHLEFRLIQIGSKTTLRLSSLDPIE